MTDRHAAMAANDGASAPVSKLRVAANEPYSGRYRRSVLRLRHNFDGKEGRLPHDGVPLWLRRDGYTIDIFKVDLFIAGNLGHRMDSDGPSVFQFRDDDDYSSRKGRPVYVATIPAWMDEDGSFHDSECYPCFYTTRKAANDAIKNAIRELGEEACDGDDDDGYGDDYLASDNDNDFLEVRHAA